MNVSIRKFEEKDIANKVEWVNNPQNNTYLHYALPLEYDKTLIWFENNKNRADRYDAVIEVDEIPVGLIGLLSIDYKNKKAEYYVLLGSVEYKGKGISKKASKLLLKYAFETLDLNKVYLYTEVENYVAQKLFESIGFLKEGRLYDDVWSNNKYCDRYIYGICKNAIYSDITQLTPIHKLDDNINTFYIKREDLLPFSFGGNKARKALLYFEEIDKGNYDIVITYGSASSNHCRVVSNLAASRDIECIVICPEEQYFETYNKKLVNMVAAKYITCPLDKVNETIEETLFQLRENGFEPYFIPGGGHGNIGTQAYVNCYKEIKVWERDNDISFDYIFHASGTGTTQAGLVCGKLLYGGKVEIVGISIARKNPRGSQIIIDSVNEFLDAPTKEIEGVVKFIDEYIGEGYGKTTLEVNNTLNVLWKKYGIPMDSTYTAKAYAGMLDYLKMNKITNKTFYSFILEEHHYFLIVLRTYDMNVLILSCGTRNKIVQYFKKAVADNGLIIATDMNKTAPALFEADKYYIVPSISEVGYINIILEICNNEKIDAILSLIDPELSLLAMHEELFKANGVMVIGSSLNVCDKSLDKYEMYNWLEANGYKTAKTFVSWEDFELSDIDYPIFIKPIKGSASISIAKANDKETAMFLFNQNKNMLIQEFLDGQEIGADVYIDMISGEVISIFTKQKLLMKSGETDKALSFKDEKLFELLERFVTEFGYRGQIDIDIFEVDGEYYISEVNPRFGGGYPHAYECGVDHMKLVLNNAAGKVNVKNIGSYEEGIYMMKYAEVMIRK